MRNQLLSRLLPSDLALLRPHLEPVPVAVGQTLMTRELPIEHVHFLEAGLVSDLASAGQGQGRWVECGLIGRDGVVAVPAVLGLDRGAHVSTVQIGGASLRLSIEELWRAMDRSAPIRRVLLSYAHVFMTQTAQSAACNARHTIVERLARWLLMAHDRIDGERIPLTHEFLSLMLGTRRMGVTEALHILESSGSIKSKRALVLVIDRTKLERSACGCYDIVRHEVERVFGR